MKLWSVFKFSLREQLRSPLELLLIFTLIPSFLWMYWSYMSGGSTSYAVLVINQDTGICPVSLAAGLSCAEQAIASMKQVAYENGDPLLRVKQIDDLEQAQQMLRSRDAAALLIFPANFSQAISSAIDSSAHLSASSAALILSGDLNNPYYSVAGFMSTAVVDEYLRSVTGQVSPVQLVEKPLGGSSSRSEFETYVPGLLVASSTLMLYSIAIAITRQIEAGTVRRLQITRMSAFDFLGGISLLYTIIAILSLLIAFLVAELLGFHSLGPLWLGILICALTSFSVIGIGLITACLSGTTARAAILANFPLILLLFFSGSIFPMPKLNLFTLGGHTFQIFDLLPHTHAVLALNKVLSLGSGFEAVSFELAMLTLLSIFYFLAGVWLFHRRHMRAV